ncbi:Tat proofreading chaperone DmsD [Uliginosibacterium sp. sgz301328]|uniref:Tat proofreading chaperone DmsD n=1 Tax=Uliginosibacterium sp. sgz301328 TaxID=3243764 RepID=UPI00359EE110
MNEVATDAFSEERAAIAACGKVLGTLFYYPPSHPAHDECLALLTDLPSQWPYGRPEELNAIQYELHSMDGADDAHQTLFVGPAHLEAPPWGSVYLDEERVLFGASTLEWRDFLRRNGLTRAADQHDPDDHFGLMCLAMAQVSEDADALHELLQAHLLPWSDRYLELLESAAPPGHFGALARLARLTLTDIAARAQLQPNARPIYI